MGSWAEEDIAGIAGWGISCAVRHPPYNSPFYKMPPNVRLIRYCNHSAAAPVCSYLLWHQLPIKLGYLGGKEKAGARICFNQQPAYFLSRPVDWKLEGRREVLKVFD